MADYLNDVFLHKESKRPFTSADVYMYVRHGSIPMRYGGFKVSVVKISDRRGRLIKLHDNDEIEKLRVTRDE